nr:Werner Syndrome-like exonuclease [Leptinotarsa decemlineata]
MEISTSRILRRRLTPEEKADQTKKLKLEKDKLETEAASKIKRAVLRPFIKYQGKIFYHTELIDMAMSGSGRTAVIQISPDLNTCYILHVSKIKYLPKSLSEFLEHDKVRLTGNNVKNDARKLARDFTGVNGDKLVQNCIDLGVLANSILPTTHRWSLEKLVNYLLDLRINKSKMVRNSKWHIIPLSPAQQKYAAIDSHVSLLLYVTLKEKEKDKEDDQNTLNK